MQLKLPYLKTVKGSIERTSSAKFLGVKMWYH